MSKKSTNTAKAAQITAYDEVPYASYPFSVTNPGSIQAVSNLFGLSPKAADGAKILELGCASGNNILAMAMLYPNSKCVGVDLSEVQINQGKARIKELGVKNLELKQVSILDINAKFGKFDYIICHGVFSWVPKAVQEKILEVCKQNLEPNGVAYVSYNTLPGWAGVQALRDMMLYHTARFNQPQQKAEQARLLLKFIQESLGEGNKNPYAEIINNELNILKNQSDWYLLHDHLEENNTPVYFHQFMDLASKNGLQYLAETTLSTMYTGNLPKATADVLATSDDIVRTEQYMDFVYNRRFRTTLLCHADRILKRSITPETIKDFYFTSRFNTPEGFADYNFNTSPQFGFTSPNNITISTNDRTLMAALKVLAEQKNKPIHFTKLIKETVKLLSSHGVKIDVSDEILQDSIGLNLLKCIFAGGVLLHKAEAAFESKVTAKPKAFALAAYQSQQDQTWITTMRQESANINAFDKALLPLLDGKNTVTQIAEKLLPLFESKQLSMNYENQPITDAKTIKARLPEFINNVLTRYAELALLEA
jgi:methyltransferase-like protein/2-polyprenyl-3-methyl-5-hydroxy-6-metoxy-1,4-benzoquinol methylase